MAFGSRTPSSQQDIQEYVQTENGQSCAEGDPPVHIGDGGLCHQIQHADSAKDGTGQTEKGEPTQKRAQTENEKTAGKGNVQQRAAVTGIRQSHGVGEQRGQKGHQSRQKQPEAKPVAETKNSLGINNWFDDNNKGHISTEEDDDYLNDVISILKRNSGK